MREEAKDVEGQDVLRETWRMNYNSAEKFNLSQEGEGTVRKRDKLKKGQTDT